MLSYLKRARGDSLVSFYEQLVNARTDILGLREFQFVCKCKFGILFELF